MLKPINFKNSIRGDNIQSNFEFLDERIRSESLFTAGRGIIEGLEISIVDNYNVKVSPGRFIDATGEEVSFPGGQYRIKRFEPVEREVRGLKVNAIGQISLPSRPYTSVYGGYFTTGYYDYLYPTNELTFRSTATGVNAKAVKIENEVVTFDAGMWSGREMNVKYLYARNRMDTILVNKKNGVVVVTGTMSPSMSHIDLEDYKDYIVVGMIEVSINHDTELTIHTGERQERPVYVDADNTLFLNGTEYRRIFFEMPESPKQNDVYVDYKNNDIYAYIHDQGVLSWQKVNGPSAGIRKEIKIFSPDSDDFPSDMQFFMFDEKFDVKYHFIPGLNQLEVIIDNAPLMSDQFEEVLAKTEDLNNGRGFKLKDPLDKPAYVEVRVTHGVEDINKNKAYQRSATFSKENISFVGAPDEVLYEAAAPYDAGEYQLEVYYKGEKKYKDLDYFETDKDGKSVSNGELCTHFKFARSLDSGEEIVSRVTKNVYSYDHIAKVIENSYGSIKAITEQVNAFNELLELSSMETDERLFRLETETAKAKVELNKLSRFITKDDAIEKKQLHEDINDGLMKEPFEHIVPCESIVNIEDLKTTDLIFVFKISKGIPSVLLKDLDYSIQQSGDDVVLILEDALVDISATILVKGVKFGI